MKLVEFVDTIVFGMLSGINNFVTFDEMAYTYDNKTFFLPRIYCNDGFNISVQLNNGNYCSSVNGVRKFGLDWKEVEWGFPSAPIDGKKYNAEDVEDTTNSVGGYVDINLLDELLEEHGGIDLLTTLNKGLYLNE
jgi:hypothetical protein